MSAQHTPGPWRLALTDDTTVIAMDGTGVARMLGDYTYGGDEAVWPVMEANARLIAAAPDMLAALDDAPIMSKYHGQRGFEADRFISDYEAWRVKARAAIAKAEAAQ